MFNRVVLLQVQELFPKDRHLGEDLINTELVLHHHAREVVTHLPCKVRHLDARLRHGDDLLRLGGRTHGGSLSLSRYSHGVPQTVQLQADRVESSPFT